MAAIEAKRTLSLSTFIGSLGIEHLGTRRAERMRTAADGSLTTLDAWRSGRLRDAGIAASAGAPNIGSAMQDGIDAASDLIDRLLARGVKVHRGSAAAARTAAPAKGRVCIGGALPSGLRKADYTEPLRAAGYDLVDDVSQGLTFLVVADPSATTNKAQKAR